MPRLLHVLTTKNWSQTEGTLWGVKVPVSGLQAIQQLKEQLTELPEIFGADREERGKIHSRMRVEASLYRVSRKQGRKTGREDMYEVLLNWQEQREEPGHPGFLIVDSGRMAPFQQETRSIEVAVNTEVPYLKYQTRRRRGPKGHLEQRQQNVFWVNGITLAWLRGYAETPETRQQALARLARLHPEHALQLLEQGWQIGVGPEQLQTRQPELPEKMTRILLDNSHPSVRRRALRALRQRGLQPASEINSSPETLNEPDRSGLL